MTATELGPRALAALALATSHDPNIPTAQVVDRLHEIYLEAEDEPVVRSRVAAALARVWVRSEDIPRGSTYADEAVRLAEQLDDRVVLAEALDARLVASPGPDDLDTRVEASAWLAEVAAHVTNPDVRLGAHLWRLMTALEQLELPTIRRQLAALDLLADETGEDRIRFFACSRRAMFALTEGDVVGAARLSAEATAAGVAARLPETDSVQQTLHTEMARQRDDRATMSRMAEALEQQTTPTGPRSSLAEAAALWLEGGRPVRAARLVDRLSTGLVDLPRTADWLLVMAKTCEAATGSGRPDVAATCVDQLSPYAGRAVLTRGAVAFAGVVEDYLALATGDVRQADRARTSYARIGADWWSRRGPLSRTRDQSGGSVGSRLLHLHPVDATSPATLWCVGREGAFRMVPSLQGLEYIRLLLESPGADVPAVELAALGVSVDAGRGELVDQQDLADHRRRVRELDDAIERDGDAAMAEQLGGERERMTTRARSGGISSWQRAGTEAERTRVAVRQAIMSALARLELHDAEVARALRSSIRAGSTCRYDPDPFRPVEWCLRSGHCTAPRVDT